jgi:hypothetical protein
MPRNPQIAAKQKLEAAVVMDRRSEAARKKARDTLYKAMVGAVEAGMTRYAVAKIAGVSPVRVGQVPGMPAGKNAVRTTDAA